MTDDKVQVVAWVAIDMWKTGEFWPDDCFCETPGEGLTPLVLAADYEAAITQMKSVTEYAQSLEKLIDWDEMAQHYGVSVAKHNLGKRPTPRLPRPYDYACPAEEVDHDR